MRSIVVILCLFLFLPGAFAQGESQCEELLSQPEAENLMLRVEKCYAQISALKAEFIQRSYFLGLDETVVSEGRVFFKKPGMMDWLYEKPEKQRFVADGETLWFYQPELNQVSLGDFKSSFSSELPVSFLLGVGSLSEKFRLVSACQKPSEVVLELLPKEPDPNLEEFRLFVTAKDQMPLGAEIVDAGGNETSFRLRKLEVDISISEDHFSFQIPRGVDIIDRRAPDRGVVSEGLE